MSAVLSDAFRLALEKTQTNEDMETVRQLARKFKVKLPKQEAK